MELHLLVVARNVIGGGRDGLLFYVSDLLSIHELAFGLALRLLPDHRNTIGQGHQVTPALPHALDLVQEFSQLQHGRSSCSAAPSDGYSEAILVPEHVRHRSREGLDRPALN